MAEKLLIGSGITVLGHGIAYGLGYALQKGKDTKPNDIKLGDTTIHGVGIATISLIAASSCYTSYLNRKGITIRNYLMNKHVWPFGLIGVGYITLRTAYHLGKVRAYKKSKAGGLQTLFRNNLTIK